jgi:hypothetical protein
MAENRRKLCWYCQKPVVYGELWGWKKIRRDGRELFAPVHINCQPSVYPPTGEHKPK